MAVTHKLYGLLGENYYEVPYANNIMIPSNMDVNTTSIQTEISDTYPTAKINIYNYFNNLTTNDNDVRVQNMKDFLKGNEVKDLYTITDGYVIGLVYELYNKNGKLIKSGQSEVSANYSGVLLFDEIKEKDLLNYRHAMIFNGDIQLNIPQTACYGIKTTNNDYPYTIKIKKIYLLTTIGGKKYIIDTDTQVDDDTHCHGCGHVHHAYDANYRCHHHDTICNPNFASCFISNAKLGTTLIDQVVTSAKLEIPEEYTEVKMCDIDCSDSSYTIKLNKKLTVITITLELLLDTFNEVYNYLNIENIILENNDSPTIPDDSGGLIIDIIDDGEPIDDPDPTDSGDDPVIIDPTDPDDSGVDDDI